MKSIPAISFVAAASRLMPLVFVDTRANNAAWKEGDHPRDEEGKFSETGAGVSSAGNASQGKSKTPEETGDVKPSGEMIMASDVAAKKQKLQSMRPVPIENTAPADLKEARKWAKDKYPRDEIFTVGDDGRQVKMVMSGFDKVKSHSADRRTLLLVPKLKELIESAVPIYTEKDHAQGSNVELWRHYAAKTTIAGENGYVRLAMWQEHGKLLFDFFHDAQFIPESAIKNKNRQPEGRDPLTMGSGPQAGDGGRFVEWWDSVKDEKTNTAPLVFLPSPAIAPVRFNAAQVPGAVRFVAVTRFNYADEGRSFTADFIEPADLNYTDQGGGIEILRKETIDRALASMVGVPVIIDHQDVTPANRASIEKGTVSSTAYNAQTNWYSCAGKINDAEAQALIKQGYNVSCAFTVDSYGPPVNDHGYRNAREITGLTFTHLAIVKNPRFAGASIRLNSQQQTTTPTTTTTMSMINWFKKKVGAATAEASQIDPATKVRVNSTTTATLADLIAAHRKNEAAAAEAEKARENEFDADSEIEIDGKKVKANDLVAAYKKQNNIPDEKTNDGGETDEEKKKKENEAGAAAKAGGEKKNAGDAAEKEKTEKENAARANAAAAAARENAAGAISFRKIHDARANASLGVTTSGKPASLTDGYERARAYFSKNEAAKK